MYPEIANPAKKKHGSGCLPSFVGNQGILMSNTWNFKNYQKQCFFEKKNKNECPEYSRIFFRV